MFKRQKVGEEILEEMFHNLQRNNYEQKTVKLNKRIEALDLLNKAAINLESAGLHKEAEAIIRTMEMAAEEKPPTIKKSPTIAEQVQNLKEYGMPLEPTDAQKAEDTLYAEYMRDPEVAIEVAVDEDGNREEKIPSADELLLMWNY